MQTLLSAHEMKMLIADVVNTIDFAKSIRKGQWDASLFLDVATHLDRRVQEKRNSGGMTCDKDTQSILSLLALMFYSKDKFGYRRGSQEYLAIEQLYGRMIAALGLP